jgi:hypothetical protein
MKVVNAAGESEMNQDQWEAASAFSILPFLLLSNASAADPCLSQISTSPLRSSAAEDGSRQPNGRAGKAA